MTGKRADDLAARCKGSARMLDQPGLVTDARGPATVLLVLLASGALAACAVSAPSEGTSTTTQALTVPAGVLVCDRNQIRCGTACTDIASDSLNCGDCSRACAPGQTCVGGSCLPRSKLHALAGVAASPCGELETLCGSSCVRIFNNDSNCGACGRTCHRSEECFGVACVPR